MEHEVAVPFPLDDVQRALSDPQRLSRCVPGLQVDAADRTDNGHEVTGRLRLRVGSSTITYRGVLRIAQEDGVHRFKAEGREARGDGTVTAALSVTLDPMDGGTHLRMSGTATADGRMADAGDKVATSVGRRLLDRFSSELETVLGEAPTEAEADAEAEAHAKAKSESESESEGKSAKSEATETAEVAEAAGAAAPAPAPEAVEGEAPTTVDEASESEPAPERAEEPTGEQESPAPIRDQDQDQDQDESAGDDAATTGAAPEAEPEAEAVADSTDAQAAEPAESAGSVPEVSDAEDSANTAGADADADTDATDEGVDAPEEQEAPDAEDSPARSTEEGPSDQDGPASESASESADPAPATARRTMIGRSMEEVDHAPPRGRYAPVPEPDTTRTGEARRWAGPVAAALLASAVMVKRLLRRRR